MDYSFSTTQEMLRKALRDFFQKECPFQLIREVEETGAGYSPELYSKMAALGFLGLTFPKEYGGAGNGWPELAILCEEGGRVLVPVPFISSVVLAGHMILRFGTEQQRSLLLPDIATGRAIMAFAWMEGPNRRDTMEVSTRARRVGEGFVLQGEKAFVADALSADRLLILARLEGARPEERALFLVDESAPGVSLKPLVTQSGQALAHVSLRDVGVASGALLSGGPIAAAGLEDSLAAARVAAAALCVGGAQAALDMAVEYAKGRVQFDHPIGSFQAIQHKLADVWLAVEKTRWLTYHTAWRVQEGLDYVTQAAMAQLLAGKAFRDAAIAGTLVMGGYGFMQESDMQFFYRRAKAMEQLLGSPEELKGQILAASGLGAG